MNEIKTTEILRTMLQIMQLSKEIAAKNRETVECVNKALTLLANDN